MLDRLFKTTLILSSTQVLSRLLSFGFSLILARYLGVELFGKFTYAYSLVFLLIVVVDFGLSMLTVREMVQNKSDVNSYLLHSLLIRLFLAGILYSILYYYSAAISNLDIEKGRLIKLLGLYLFVRAVFDTTITYFQAYERQDINGYLNLANNLVLIIAGIGFVIFQKNVLYFAIAPILAGIIASIISLYILLPKISLKFNLSFKFLKTLFINTVPFGITLFATAAYARMNIIILSWLRSDLEVGEYGASLRLVEGFLIIPIVGARIIYPVLSRFSKDMKSFQTIVEKSIKILIISAFFIITVGFISSEVIIISLYSSSYANSVVIFQILVITLISAYPNYVLGSALFSLNRQKMVLKVVFSALILNIILSLSLIPILGGSGAALAELFSGLSILLGYIWILRDRISSINLISMFFRPFLITFLLILISMLAIDSFPLYYKLPIIAFSYIALSYIFKLIKRSEISKALDLLTNIIRLK